MPNRHIRENNDARSDVNVVLNSNRMTGWSIGPLT